MALSNSSDVTKHSSNKDEQHVGIDNRRQSSAMTCNSCPGSLLFLTSRDIKKNYAPISLLKGKQQSLLHGHKWGDSPAVESILLLVSHSRETEFAECSFVLG